MDKKRQGLVLITIGVLAWPVGIAAGLTPLKILPFHLAFVLSGVYLRKHK